MLNCPVATTVAYPIPAKADGSEKVSFGIIDMKGGKEITLKDMEGEDDTFMETASIKKRRKSHQGLSGQVRHLPDELDIRNKGDKKGRNI